MKTYRGYTDSVTGVEITAASDNQAAAMLAERGQLNKGRSPVRSVPGLIARVEGIGDGCAAWLICEDDGNRLVVDVATRVDE